MSRTRARRASPGVAAALIVMVGAATSGAAAPAPAVLGDYGSTFFAQGPRPPAIDAPFRDLSVVRLRWSGWGGGRATATGSARLNTCLPSCADGRIVVVPGARVTATRQVRGACRGRALRFYTRIAIAFPRLPAGAVRPQLVTARPRCAGG